MANKLRVGDIVRWTDDPGWQQRMPEMEDLREPFTVVQVGMCYVDPSRQPNHRGFVVVRDSRGEFGWFNKGMERLDPRWLKLDPFLTAVHRRRNNAETNPRPETK